MSAWFVLSCAACSSVAAPDASPRPVLDTMSSALPELETSSGATSIAESSSSIAPSETAPSEMAPSEAAPDTEAPAVVDLVQPSAAPDAGVPLVPPAAALGAGPVLLPDDAPTLAVSLTFDDTFAPQLDAAATLEAHGLHGTFYVNSPRLYDGSANGAASLYMSVEDALALQARGHEIGGHTLSHPQLTTLPESERVREILVDRAQLLALGFAAHSFAYPDGDAEGDSDPALGRSVLDVARSSGYSSARDTNGVSLANCTAGSETLPPLDAYRLRSIRSVNDHPPVAEGAPPLPPDTADTLLSWMDHVVSCGGRVAAADFPSSAARLFCARCTGQLLLRLCRARSVGDRACRRRALPKRRHDLLPHRRHDRERRAR
jgi:peptidoglycan/xylan/chitin deacetylase (PgdA/CDA1 family)